MNKRPLCFGALALITVIAAMLFADTFLLEDISLPLTLKESAAAGLISDKEPVTVAGNVYKRDKKNEKYLLYLNNVYLYKENAQGQDKIKLNQIIIYEDLQNKIPIGNKIKVFGKAKKFEKASNPGQFDAYLYYKILNVDFAVYADKIDEVSNKYGSILYVIKNKLCDLREHLSINIDASSGDNAGILKAMLLGDKSDFDEAAKELYQAAGIIHLACISGLHISIIGMSVFNLLRRLKADYLTSAAMGVFIIICFGAMTGFSISTIRAVIMYVISIGARLLGRTYDLLSSLSLAAILMLLHNPLYILNSGFLMSFGAIIGIGAVMPVFIEVFNPQKNIFKALAASFCVSIVTIPLIAYFYYEISIYSILLNIIVIPMMSYVLISGIAGCIFAGISIRLGVFMFGMANTVLSLYEMLAKAVLRLPFAVIAVGKPPIGAVLIYYVLLTALLLLLKKYKKPDVLLLAAVMAFVLSFRYDGSDSRLSITMLDVGQGDGIIIEKGNNTITVDGGSSDTKNVGKYRIMPYLKARGRTCIDYSFITHPDMDHISGIEELIEDGYKIKNLVLPYIQQKDEAYCELLYLAQAKGINVCFFKRGDTMTIGDLKIECLHPDIDYVPASVNDYSIVLSLEYKKFNMLMTGDLEEKGEKKISQLIEEEYSNIEYDALKVAHHGSKNSTKEEFLKVFSASYALISAGRDNRYGHPHEETVKRLQNDGSIIINTQEAGAIMLKINGERLSVDTYLRKAVGINR